MNTNTSNQEDIIINKEKKLLDAWNKAAEMYSSLPKMEFDHFQKVFYTLWMNHSYCGYKKHSFDEDGKNINYYEGMLDNYTNIINFLISLKESGKNIAIKDIIKNMHEINKVICGHSKTQYVESKNCDTWIKCSNNFNYLYSMYSLKDIERLSNYGMKGFDPKFING